MEANGTMEGEDSELSQTSEGKYRDPLIRDPLFLSLLSLIKAICSLTDSYVSLLDLVKDISHRISKGGVPIFPYERI